MAAGWVGILSVELHFPESRSLKDKRMHLRSLKAQLQNRVGASVAEVDHHDTWQRARVTLSCVAREYSEAVRLLDEADRWLHAQDWVVTGRRATSSRWRTDLVTLAAVSDRLRRVNETLKKASPRGSES